MNLRQFNTNKPLWIFFSSLLFLTPWFVMPCGKGNDMTPAGLWIVLFQYPDHFFGAAAGLFGFTLLFGIPAVAIGWVLQSIVSVITHGFKKPPPKGVTPPCGHGWWIDQTRNWAAFTYTQRPLRRA